jgi:hypothetical protein
VTGEMAQAHSKVMRMAPLRAIRFQVISLSVGSGKSGGESGIVFRPISEITATMEKSFYPFVIANTFRIATMKSDGG